MTPAEEMATASVKWRAWVVSKVGPQDADDVLQSALLGGIEALARNPDIRSAEAYFVRILQNQFFVAYRTRMKRRRDVRVDLALTLRDKRPSASDLVSRNEKQATALAALRKLPPLWSEILTRFYFNEESSENIQRDLGLTATQFRLTKSRAKKEVRIA